MSLIETVAPDHDELLRAVADPLMREFGRVTLSADERASVFIEAFQQSHAGDLPDHFMPPAAEANPFSNADNIRSLDNPREAAQAVLGRLPFIDVANMKLGPFPTRSLILHGDMHVPAERVISVRSFTDWKTGSSAPENATRLYQPDNLGLGPGSLNAIINYAALPQETQPKGDGSVMVIARDKAGEYWGVLQDDGSHRAGAQKLRGDSHIQVREVVIDNDEAMLQIPYNLRTRAPQ